MIKLHADYFFRVVLRYEYLRGNLTSLAVDR